MKAGAVANQYTFRYCKTYQFEHSLFNVCKKAMKETIIMEKFTAI